MQGVWLRAFGAPDALQFGALPDPVPREGWVAVELRAAALNCHDCLVRQGVYAGVPLPRVLGADGAGVRRDTGEEVVILPSLRWGGDDRAPGPSWEILGDYTDGTYAELVAVPAENLYAKPRNWSWAAAAALPLAGLTAYRALFSRGRLRSGETVLVLGAGGGVALIAVGLAAIAGARVLVTSSSDDKLALARSLGAAGGRFTPRRRGPRRSGNCLAATASTWSSTRSGAPGRIRWPHSGPAGGSSPSARLARPARRSTSGASTSGSTRSSARLWAARETSRRCC